MVAFDCVESDDFMHFPSLGLGIVVATKVHVLWNKLLGYVQYEEPNSLLP
jgi:hypothetical protein